MVATCKSASAAKSISGTVDPRTGSEMRRMHRRVVGVITSWVLLCRDDGYAEDLVAMRTRLYAMCMCVPWPA